MRPQAEPTDEQAADWLRGYAEHRDPAGRQRVILAHLDLADRLAAGYQGRLHTTPDDLRQTARLGLIGAVDRYDPAHGTRFGPTRSPASAASSTATCAMPPGWCTCPAPSSSTHSSCCDSASGPRTAATAGRRSPRWPPAWASPTTRPAGSCRRPRPAPRCRWTCRSTARTRPPGGPAARARAHGGGRGPAAAAQAGGWAAGGRSGPRRAPQRHHQAVRPPRRACLRRHRSRSATSRCSWPTHPAAARAGGFGVREPRVPVAFNQPALAV